MTRLLLIGLLTVLSFSAYSLDEQPIKPWVETKKVPTDLGSCDLYYANDPTSLVSFSDCKSQAETSARKMGATAQWDMGGITTQAFDYYGSPAYWVFLEVRNTSGGKVTAAKWVKQQSSTSEVCPPDGAPEYTVGPVPESPQNPTHQVCKMKFEPCPLGFFAKAVSNSSGGAPQCVPINCPSKGAQSNSVANWNGMLKVNDIGIYCDGRCAYQLDSVPYTGASFVTGTSLGSICGQGNPNEAKLTPKDSESTCETYQLSSGGSFISCDGKNEIPEPDTGEGDLKPAADTAKVDPNQKPSKYQGADCTNSADKMTCVGTDIVNALDHQTEQNKLQSDEKHNKNILFQLAINEYLEKNNRERANRLSSDMQNQTQQFVYGINSVTNAINQNGGTGGSGGLGKDELDDSLDKLVETFDGDSVIAQLASFLDEKNSQLDSANNELESKLNEGLSKFNDTDAVWEPFKRIPDMLPPEYSCQPFILSIDAHPLTLDFCEYEDLIKRVIGFVFILLTALRLFYQAQVIIRNAAIGSA